MSFEPLDILEVPPLSSVNLDAPNLHVQLVSSTLLSTARSDSPELYRIDPITIQPQPGIDPVLDSFTKRSITYEAEQTNLPGPSSPFRPLTRTFSGDIDIDSSPGTSKWPIRTSASDSSLSSLESSFWDDKLRQAHQPATVKFRGSPAKHRVLDLAIQQPILEALQETTCNPLASSATDQHLAPVHSAQQVLRSLIVTATTGTSSDHFQWEPDTASFVWSATLQHRKNVRQLRKLVKEQAALQASMVAADDNADAIQQLSAAMTQPWIGSERIKGWSQAASDSVILPFLEIGALLRRIDDRVLAIHRSAAGLSSEAPALAAALDTVVTWLKSEFTTYTSTLTSQVVSHESAPAAILNAHAELEACFAMLKTLGNLLSCGQPRLPPFRPLKWLDSTHATLSHLHAHLAASLASGAPSLPSAVLAYLLDRTSFTWRQLIARWVGFPGFESDRTGELDDRPHTLKPDSTVSHVYTPWSGAVVDWSLDERGEEDVGYTLKPSAVPSFLPFRHARVFLEAGRALRLLKKAAPKDHPLVQQWSLHAHEKASAVDVELPTWRWTIPDSQIQATAVQEQIVQFKREIARWRQQRRKARRATAETVANPRVSPLGSRLSLASPGAGATSDGNTVGTGGLAFASTIEDQFSRMSQLFTALPGNTDALTTAMESSGLDHDTNSFLPSPNAKTEVDAFLIYLSAAACPPTPSHSIALASFDRVTQSSLVAPFESWARLINMSLISVFFQDLGLGTYLETCKRFLLLGSVHFERQMVSSLFDVDHASLPDDATSSSPSRSVVAMNKRLTAEGVWPPNDTLLSSALNTAVIETVSGMRQAHEESLLRSGRSEDAVSLAFRDLDERLSFAVVEPPFTTSASRGGKAKPTWTDPSSIDALDWLTLSFHPPPLISPLLTQLAQSRYQRLWNMLLRIKRCKAAIRSAWCATFKSTSAAFTLDFRVRAIMQQFRWELNHFLDTFGAFVQEVGIEGHWKRFMQRLDGVRVEVSDELSCRSSHRTTAVGNGEVGDADLEEEDLEEEEKVALMTSSLELKDVFSLARYHERVLDRMLSTCFLKSKQRGVLNVINSLLQTVLDFAQLCIDFQMPTSADFETPSFDDFSHLHRYFRSRMDTFVQALLILKDRRFAISLSTDPANRGKEQDGLYGKRRQDVEAEKARLAEDELEDLRRLDVDELGRSVDGVEGEGVGSVEFLLVRLNASGFYAELD
ncbi:uncharacterized protein MEPE_05159 [Melanopsichium pennsylvanicum]|uniref:Spindle pole body component n=2 Tax=Melanopsichium pennsylvanicum TaxID=63383 RepID=A0AAJ4XPK8_9BASI|nr:conserved hypothetical protein [Melanopsichium pennsylvanicum 4]SNX86450.1 uncharacterized protein MEPE_05159 [Melanopsichium pennsylvanicum]